MLRKSPVKEFECGRWLPRWLGSPYLATAPASQATSSHMSQRCYAAARMMLNRPSKGNLPVSSNTGAVTRNNPPDTFAANGV